MRTLSSELCCMMQQQQLLLLYEMIDDVYVIVVTSCSSLPILLLNACMHAWHLLGCMIERNTQCGGRTVCIQGQKFTGYIVQRLLRSYRSSARTLPIVTIKDGRR